MTRDRKPKGFFYLNHVSVDGAHSIIIDTHLTPGNVHDSTPYLQRLDKIKENFKLSYKYAGGDTGYFNIKILRGLKTRNIHPVIGPRRFTRKEKKYSKAQFTYVEEWDVYMCPNLNPLEYTTTTRQGYSEYESKSKYCTTCPKKEKCLYSNQETRIIRRHVEEDLAHKAREFMKTEKGLRYYKRRKETVERCFADAKELHGLRYAHYRGGYLVHMQCLMTATAQNIKKIATLLSRKGSNFLIYLLYWYKLRVISTTT